MRLISLSVLTTRFGQFARKSGQNRYEAEKVVRSDKKMTESRETQAVGVAKAARAADSWAGR
jgi:hypothetical protein